MFSVLCELEVTKLWFVGQSEELKKTLSGMGSEHSKLKAQKDSLEKLCRALQKELQSLRSCSTEFDADDEPISNTPSPIDEGSVQEQQLVEGTVESASDADCNQT